jgi:transcriptional regulator with XRE-family HTH domain
MGKTNAEKKSVSLTKGCVTLRQLVEDGLKQCEIAKAVGVGASTVSRWLTGERAPDKDHMKKLFEHYEIPVGDWLTPARPRRKSA